MTAIEFAREFEWIDVAAICEGVRQPDKETAIPRIAHTHNRRNADIITSLDECFCDAGGLAGQPEEGRYGTLIRVVIVPTSQTFAIIRTRLQKPDF